MKKYYIRIIASNAPLNKQSNNLARFIRESNRKKPASAILESNCIWIRANVASDRSIAIARGETPVTD